MNEVKIRMATLEDVNDLLNIYQYYVEETAISFEYHLPTKEEFEERMIKVLKIYPYLVAELDHQIVGYAYASTFHERDAYGWCVETSIYVNKDIHGKGIGKSLYETLESILKKQNILNMYACIAYPNDESITFHKKLGFHEIGHFHKCGYKFNQYYDMVWMEKIIQEHSIDPVPVKIIKDIDF